MRFGDYTTDLGYTFYGVALSVQYVSVRQDVTDVDPDPYLPAVYKAQTRLATDRDKPCPLRVTPRETWLVLTSGDYFRVVNPFQVGSLFWSTFHTEAQVNPLIARVERKPERINPYVLSLLMR